MALAADDSNDINARLAISDQLAQYPYRWDSKNSESFAELYTDDGIMERWQDGKLVASSRVEGKEAILEYAKRSHQGRLADRQTRHHFSGLVILELTKTSAITENMALITHQTSSDPAPIIRSSGIYRISWRKTESGWLISKRVLYTDRFRDSSNNQDSGNQ